MHRTSNLLLRNKPALNFVDYYKKYIYFIHKSLIWAEFSKDALSLHNPIPRVIAWMVSLYTGESRWLMNLAVKLVLALYWSQPGLWVEVLSSTPRGPLHICFIFFTEMWVSSMNTCIFFFDRLLSETVLNFITSP